MTDQPTSYLIVQDWPILLTLEQAARYLSLDGSSFLELVKRFKVCPVDAGANMPRWNRRDLEKVIRQLPTLPFSNSDAPRPMSFDEPTIRKIVDLLAPRLLAGRSGAMSEFVSLQDTAKTLGIGRSKIYRLINEGQIEVRHIGRRALIPRAEIERILQTGIPMSGERGGG